MCATVPPEVMQVLTQLKLDPCGAGVTKADLQRALIEGKITAAELQKTIDALKL
jgi:hypothetical protein